MDFNQLEECFKDKKVKGMILCSPHNPVGRVWNENQLRKVVDWLRVMINGLSVMRFIVI